MRYVITPDVAIHLAERDAPLRAEVQLVAPTLLRSQVLAALYGRVRAGELDRAEASRILDGIRGLRIRLLGDRVLQAKAWALADQLGWADTFDAEYVALTRLQADALVTTDPTFAAAVRDVVAVAELHDLIEEDR